MSRTYPLSMLLATTSNAKAEQVPLHREIQDWVNGCDNLRNCQAVSASAGIQHSSLKLSIQHNARDTRQLQWSLNQARQRRTLPLRTDGRPLPDYLAHAMQVETTGNESLLGPRATPREPCSPSGAMPKHSHTRRKTVVSATVAIAATGGSTASVSSSSLCAAWAAVPAAAPRIGPCFGGVAIAYQ